MELASELNLGFYGVWGGAAQPNLREYTDVKCDPPSRMVFTPTNVKQSLENLDGSAPGPDGVSANLLKASRLELNFFLAALFNIFIMIGFVPSQWRFANITPIAKVDNPDSWSDYRPISLTSNLCKTFERVLANYIIECTTHIWITNKQNGFLPGHCTQDAIVQVLFDIGRAVDKSESALAIFFDFAKAFDLVPHDILLAKLKLLLPLWLVRWIAAYLSDRKQRVKVGNTETEWLKVEAGVIQGSVLGPILFIIFIADLNEYLPNGVNLEKYADDIICYILGRKTNGTLPQSVVNAVQRWCEDNHMRLNVNKCKIINFSTKKSTAPSPISLNNIQLETVPCYKYLGVDITASLDSGVYWKRLESTIRSNIFLLKQLKSNGLEEKILITVYKSLVLSHFRYGCVVLDSCTQLDKADMQVIQNRMLRIIGTTKERALSEYGIIPVSEFIESSCFEQITRILSTANHTLPASLRITDPNRRINFPFDIPLAKTAKFCNSPVLKTLRRMRDSEQYSRRNRTT